MTFVLDPSHLRCFGSAEGAAFALCVTEALAQEIKLDDSSGRYTTLTVNTVGSYEDVEHLLKHSIPSKAHILVILPSIYFRSPPPEVLGPMRKLAVLACFSTPTSPEAICHFLEQAILTNPVQQETMVNRFFEIGQCSQQIEFIDEQYGSRAVFRHLSNDLEWHEQLGELGWGEQQLLPSGEVSTLPVSVFGQDISTRLQIDGTIAIQGIPIVHAGSVAFMREDQERIYQGLAGIGEVALLLRVEAGAVTEVRPSGPEAERAAAILSALFDVDSRYRIIVEIGFGVNTDLTPLAGNHAMNEVYGGKSGHVHFGFGLLPYTQYHIDFICPGTAILNEDGVSLLGPNSKCSNDRTTGGRTNEH